MSTTFVATMAEAYVRQGLPELRTLDPKLTTARPLAPGVLPCATNLDRTTVLQWFQAHTPIFVRHIHPVDVTVPITGQPGDLEALAAAAEPLLRAHPAGAAVAVQVRLFLEPGPACERAAVRERLDAVAASAGLVPVTQGADLILSVALHGGQALLGLSTPAENLSDWPGGEVRYRREEGQLSRAKFKLLEAFDTFGIPAPAGGRALDLGAAPGGWTSLLLERGLSVTAVDTGDLSEALLGHPALTFLKQNVEDVRFPPETFDLLTCDMSWNPLNTARMVARLAPSVKHGAHLVLTVKLMLENPTRTIRLVKEALATEFQVRRVKQLFHNRDEVTLLAVRR